MTNDLPLRSYTEQKGVKIWHLLRARDFLLLRGYTNILKHKEIERDLNEPVSVA